MGDVALGTVGRHEQGLITMVARTNSRYLQRASNSASGRAGERSPWPGGQQPGNYNLLPGEFAFSTVDSTIMSAHHAYYGVGSSAIDGKPEVATTLSGAFAEAARRFPTDEAAQARYVEQHINVLGLNRLKIDAEMGIVGTLNPHNKNGGDMLQGTTLQIGGQYTAHSHIAHMPVGALVRVRVPLPSEIQSSAWHAAPGALRNKAVLIAEPATPGSVAQRLRKIVAAHTDVSAEQLNRLQSVEARETNHEAKLAHALHQNAIVQGLVFLDALVRTGIITDFTTDANYRVIQNVPGAQHFSSPAIAMMAYALGALGDAQRPESGAPATVLNASDFNENLRARWATARTQILKTLFNTGKTAPVYDFGHDVGANANAGIDAQTGVIRNNAVGLMIQQQHNSLAATVEVFTDMLYSEQSRIMGRVTHAAEPGKSFAAII